MTNKYVRPNRRVKHLERVKRQEAQIIQLETPKPSPKPIEVAPKPSNEKLLKELRAEFKTFSETIRNILMAEKEIHLKIDETLDEKFREESHKRIAEQANIRLAEITTDIETLIARIPKKETKLIKAVEDYLEKIRGVTQTFDVTPTATPVLQLLRK